MPWICHVAVQFAGGGAQVASWTGSRMDSLHSPIQR